MLIPASFGMIGKIVAGPNMLPLNIFDTIREIISMSNTFPFTISDIISDFLLHHIQFSDQDQNKFHYAHIFSLYAISPCGTIDVFFSVGVFHLI